MNRIKVAILTLLLVPLHAFSAYAAIDSVNVEVNYAHPKKYIVGGIRVEGIKYLGEKQIISLTGLQEGKEVTIPSDQTASIVKRLWSQRFFSSVSFEIDHLSSDGDTAYFVLKLQERPRVSRWSYTGVKNSEQSDLKERLNLKRGSELSDYVIKSSVNSIKNYFKDKGFRNVDVQVRQEQDTIVKNAVRVAFDINRGEKVKIKTIEFVGNDNVPEGKIIKNMAKTRDMRIRNMFKSHKFKEKEYEEDKVSMMSAFSEAGFRDARLVKDSIYYINPKRIGIRLEFEEGQRYYFRNITWTGNSIYPSEYLDEILNIKKGDIYDVVTMEKRLQGDPKKQEMDVASLYRDQGYLFFNIMPVEVCVEKDSVDVEMRMVEGKPATFNKILITGNTVTNEKVVRRQIYTKPGYLYSQSYLERSIREIASMGHFDPEYASDPSRGFSIIPNQMSNTVDVSYNVSEKPNSQFELSGGWGGNSFVGTIGVSFNNFSIRRMFKKHAWKPVPLGDAQQLSLRFQTNGTYYTNASLSFMEPWLFGKKPTSLTFGAFYSKQTNSYYFYQNSDQWFKVFGASLGIGKRLKWPDNYFTLHNQLSWQTYKLQNWGSYFLFPTGTSNNINYTITFARSSTDQPIYPRQGSDFALSLSLTPPYSLFRSADTDYDNMSDAEKYHWIEFHKWSFKGSVFTKLIGDLVMMTRMQFGYLGYYNGKLGYSPFEGFQVGGDGMSGYNTYGAEIIALRGYENYSLTPKNDNGVYVGHVYDKFTLELRYPVILQPQSTIYVLAFLEGGNCWEHLRDFNPFSIKRSAGVGVRIMLPMVGLLGVDWGWGFDPVGNKSQGGSNFHFVIGQQF